MFSYFFYLFTGKSFKARQNSFKSLKAYQFEAEASLIYPSFYFVSLFQNKTEFKINNNSPGEELSKFILKFEKVNNGLVSMFLQNRIGDDPVIDDFLNSNTCSSRRLFSCDEIEHFWTVWT